MNCAKCTTELLLSKGKRKGYDRYSFKAKLPRTNTTVKEALVIGGTPLEEEDGFVCPACYHEASKINVDVIQANPSTTEGVTTIMKALAEYTPSNLPVLCNGDQMSIERMNGATLARADAKTPEGRLQHLVPFRLVAEGFTTLLAMELMDMTSINDTPPTNDFSLDKLCEDIASLVWPEPNVTHILASQPAEEVAEAPVDHQREYALDILNQVLMDQVQRDCVRQNNGPMLVALWKSKIVQFYQKHHWKYLKVAHDLIAEYMERSRGRYSEKHASRCCKISGGTGKILDESFFGRIANTYVHKSTTQQPDISDNVFQMVWEYHPLRMFKNEPGRFYESFPKYTRRDSNCPGLGNKLMEYSQDLDILLQTP